MFICFEKSSFRLQWKCCATFWQKRARTGFFLMICVKTVNELCKHATIAKQTNKCSNSKHKHTHTHRHTNATDCVCGAAPFHCAFAYERAFKNWAQPISWAQLNYCLSHRQRTQYNGGIYICNLNWLSEWEGCLNYIRKASWNAIASVTVQLALSLSFSICLCIWHRCVVWVQIKKRYKHFINIETTLCPLPTIIATLLLLSLPLLPPP